MGAVLIGCCRGISPSVREGSVAIRVEALPVDYPTRAARAGTPVGRASAPLASQQHAVRTLWFCEPPHRL